MTFDSFKISNPRLKIKIVSTIYGGKILSDRFTQGPFWIWFLIVIWGKCEYQWQNFVSDIDANWVYFQLTFNWVLVIDLFERISTVLFFKNFSDPKKYDVPEKRWRINQKPSFFCARRNFSLTGDAFVLRRWSSLNNMQNTK